MFLEENEALLSKIQTAIESADATGPHDWVPPEGTNVDGSFTTADAQIFSSSVLDAICGDGSAKLIHFSRARTNQRSDIGVSSNG